MNVAITMAAVAKTQEFKQEDQELSRSIVKPTLGAKLGARFIVSCVAGMMYGSLGYSLISTWMH